ncbi:MAG: hypothetical protein QOJ89_2152 [bacterium]|jgi:hypothetical protein
MERVAPPGFDLASVATDDVVARRVDDADVTVIEDAASAGEPLEVLRRLIERVPPGSSFQTRDSLGASMDALDVIRNPVVGGRSYLGVYHVNIGGGRFALRLAASEDLRTWRKIADLDATGAAMGTLRAVPGGGFLLAYESQGPTQPNGRKATNVRFRHYRDGGALLNGAWSEQMTLPRRLSRTNEGTPSFRAIVWRGSLAESQMKFAFHYLDSGTPDKPRKLAVDRQARGALDGGRWSVVVDAGVDRAMSTMGFHGNHGARREFHFPAGRKTWRIYEVQRLANVTGSWRLMLYDVAGRRLTLLNITTPRASKSFANPTIAVLPSPNPSAGDALVMTIFIFGVGAGSGEAGELVYHHEL